MLPASAKLPVATSTPIVVSYLGDKWLENLLRRLNKIRRSANDAAEHHVILANLLGGTEAKWNLGSIMLPTDPDDELLDGADGPFQAFRANKVIHIKGKVIHVDLVEGHDVCFKLTHGTIEALLDYHERVHCADLKTSENTYDDIEVLLKKAKDEYHQAIHAFIFRTEKDCFEEMQDDGAGELSFGRPRKVKTAIKALFKSLPEILASPVDTDASFPVSET